MPDGAEITNIPKTPPVDTIEGKIAMCKPVESSVSAVVSMWPGLVG